MREEERYAKAFRERQLSAGDSGLEEQRTAMQRRLAESETALQRAAAARADIDERLKASRAEGEARRFQEVANEVALLQEKLVEAEAATVSKEAWARTQLTALKVAFRADVSALGGWVETLRTDALRANVYARSSTRLLRQQNLLLKKRLGHNAMVALQRQRRLVAWLGWRMVVMHGRALHANSERRQREVADRDGIIDHLQARAGESHSKHARQQRLLREAHEAELLAVRDEVAEAHEALARLRTFSAHKLREMSDELERVRAGQGVAPGAHAPPHAPPHAHQAPTAAAGPSGPLRSHASSEPLFGAVGNKSAASHPRPLPNEGWLEAGATGATGATGASGSVVGEGATAPGVLFERGGESADGEEPSRADGSYTRGRHGMDIRAPRAAARCTAGLDLAPALQLSHERQLADAVAHTHKLERKLRRAQQELALLSQAHCAIGAPATAPATASTCASANVQGGGAQDGGLLPGTAGEVTDAAGAQDGGQAQLDPLRAARQRIEALEAELRQRDQETAVVLVETPRGAARRQQLLAEHDAALALQDGPFQRECDRLRHELRACRARSLSAAIRQWWISRAQLCVRAWREYVWRCKAERASAAARAIGASDARAATPIFAEGAPSRPSACRLGGGTVVCADADGVPTGGGMSSSGATAAHEIAAAGTSAKACARAAELAYGGGGPKATLRPPQVRSRSAARSRPKRPPIASPVAKHATAGMLPAAVAAAAAGRVAERERARAQAAAQVARLQLEAKVLAARQAGVARA